MRRTGAAAAAGRLVLSRQIHANGVAISYEDLGSGGRRPLVMLHGFSGHRDDFREVRDELARDRRVIIPDLRGHGDSARGSPAAYTLETLVDDLVSLLDALAIPQCDLLGHSMGGMVALRFVLAHPERVASLILMSTSPEAPTDMEPDSFVRGSAFVREHGMQALQQRIEQAGRERNDPLLAGWAEHYWSHHRRRHLAMHGEAWAGLGTAMARQRPLTERLREIACPTLVLVGEADLAFRAGADLLEQGIPGARRVTLAGAGHHPHQEARSAWLAALREHLGQA